MQWSNKNNRLWTVARKGVGQLSREEAELKVFFFFRERWKAGESVRETSMCQRFIAGPQTGTWCTAKACTLTVNGAAGSEARA